MHAASNLGEHVELVLQLSHLKQLHPPAVGAQNKPLLGDPGQAQVMGGLRLHEGKLLEVALGIAVQLEKLLASNAALCVILRVKRNLEEIKYLEK